MSWCDDSQPRSPVTVCLIEKSKVILTPPFVPNLAVRDVMRTTNK